VIEPRLHKSSRTLLRSIEDLEIIGKKRSYDPPEAARGGAGASVMLQDTFGILETGLRSLSARRCRQRVSGQVAVSALDETNFDAGFLARYETMCKETLDYRYLRRAHWARRLFLAYSRVDRGAFFEFIRLAL